MCLPSVLLAWLVLAPSVAAEVPAPFEAERGSPCVATPEAVAGAMLEVAHLGSGDTVVDPGFGDGRHVIAAAKEFGAPEKDETAGTRRASVYRFTVPPRATP